MDIRVILDSGAHSWYNTVFASAVNAGAYVRKTASYDMVKSPEFKKYLDDYIAFIYKYKDVIWQYINLDVVFNAEASWETQKYMESCGLHPIPVIHFGEDTKWLKKYLDDYDYIGIGGLGQGIGPASFIKSMGDPVFKMICGTKNLMPRAKTHGFAVTAPGLIFRYPWYSVDSTSFLKAAGFGIVMVPQWVPEKGWDFLRTTYHYVSTRFVITNTHQRAWVVGDTLDDLRRNPKGISLLRYVEEKGMCLGESKFHVEKADYILQENESVASELSNGLQQIETVVVPGITNDGMLRLRYNILFALDLVRATPKFPRPFKPVAQSFDFGEDNSNSIDAPYFDSENINFCFARLFNRIKHDDPVLDMFGDKLATLETYFNYHEKTTNVGWERICDFIRKHREAESVKQKEQVAL